MTNKYAMCITLATFCCISLPENGHASDNEGDCGINFSKSAAPSQTLIKAIESQEPAKTHYDEQRDLYYLVDADGFEETKEETSRVEFSPALSPSKASLKAEQHHEELEFFYDPERRKYYYISDRDFQFINTQLLLYKQILLLSQLVVIMICQQDYWWMSGLVKLVTAQLNLANNLILQHKRHFLHQNALH